MRITIFLALLYLLLGAPAHADVSLDGNVAGYDIPGTLTLDNAEEKHGCFILTERP